MIKKRLGSNKILETIIESRNNIHLKKKMTLPRREVGKEVHSFKSLYFFFRGELLVSKKLFKSDRNNTNTEIFKTSLKPEKGIVQPDYRKY